MKKVPIKITKNLNLKNKNYVRLQVFFNSNSYQPLPLLIQLDFLKDK